VEELLDEVYVGEDHPSAAIALEVEFCEGLSFGASVKEEGKVGVPLVTNDLAAREAADWNDHLDAICRAEPEDRCKSSKAVQM